ncbi:metalloregulator ArsR/SmtB family transcription factor [Oscillospiraceae bacterium MB08-C2-2]|nr:metalloregulator ArsR/SmtB family transcription factor [Oscillospiraceae bacterium MB08-C2-2]
MEHMRQLKALADSSRYQIIQLLLQKTYCVRALAKKLSLSAPAISQHLAVLKEAGLIDSGKRGYHTHYTVNTKELKALSAAICCLAKVEPDYCKSSNCDAFDEKFCQKKEF